MTKYTAVEMIMIAAWHLWKERAGDFTEWDLTIKVWELFPLRYGMRGYADKHPDHKRVSMELMGNKPSSPIQQKYMERPKPNHYRLTPLGQSVGAGLVVEASHKKAEIEALVYYLEHPTFRIWQNDPSLPSDIQSVAVFFQVPTCGPYCIATVRSVCNVALQVCKDHHITYLMVNRTPASVDHIYLLLDFLTALEYRFPQLKEPTRDKTPKSGTGKVAAGQRGAQQAPA